MASRRTRIGTATGAAIAVALAGTTLTAPAAATSPTPEWVATPPTESVTLITGDRVDLHDGADGSPIVEFTPAPRASGAPVTYASYGDEEHFYVIPSDVAELVPEELDLSLFDVKVLAAIGSTDGTPVIVQATDPADAKAGAPQWKALEVDADRTLESIDAIAGEVPADGATELIDAAAAGDDVEKVWLDAPVEGLDLTSAPQIGAPDAWAEGYDGTGTVVAVLDSGIDATHPDLDEGVVIAAKDFTGEGSTKDLLGHGTHVASTIAGSGEASGGDIKGIAYGAKLINARVLNAQNFGESSWIIDGLEWAAAQGADVINMSLGNKGMYTDGNDPDALAIDSISERYDALVVVAAGNEGSLGATTVSSPGTADSALTVGALDEWDQLAGFSSQGPRFGDAGVKPDITAPGANILAARAAGTIPDLPASELYYYNGGTSMAAPHVSGAAAVLKAARPDLDGEALKAVLMGTAIPTVGSIWKEGAGKVQIPTAIAEPLYAEASSLSFGVFASPRAEQKPRTQTIRYTNTGDQDLTLELLSAASGSDGQPVAPGLLSLSAPSVTVPAHGSASVDVTIDPQADDPDFYTGVVTAAGPGFSPVRTVLGFQVETNLATLHLEALQPDGSPVASSSSAMLYGIDDPTFAKYFAIVDGKADLRVPLGRYAVLGALENNKPGAALVSGSTLFTRDIDLTELGDHTVTIDGSKAKRVSIDTEKKAQPTNFEQILSRVLPGRTYPVTQGSMGSAIVSSGGLPEEVYVLAEGDLAGEEFLSETWLLAAPKLDVTATAGSKSVDISEDLRYAVLSPELRGSVSAAIVHAGSGTPAELEKASARGKIVLVEAHPASIGGVKLLDAQAEAAKDAGAIALIVYGATEGPYWEEIPFGALGQASDKALPTLTISRARGLELVDLAGANKGARVTGTGYGYPPYDYAFAKTEHGIPSDLTYRLDSANTAAVETEVSGFPAGTSMLERHYIITSGNFVGFGRWLDEPVADRTIYNFADPGVRYQHSAQAFAGGGFTWEGTPSDFFGPVRSYTPGQTDSQTFIGQVVHGGLAPDPESPSQASVRREGDTLMIDLPYRVDGEGHPNQSGPDAGTDAAFELWTGDRILASERYASGWAVMPPEEREYRVVLKTGRYERWWTQSTEVTTEWTFKSGTTDAATILPLLQLDYGVQGLSPSNIVQGKKVTLKPTVSHQDGAAASAVAGLKLWVSYDGGKAWTTVPVTGSDGAYSASFTPVKGASKIALKSEAWDAAGNRFRETVLDAIALK